MAEFDWSSTELGPLEAWPAELLTAIELCLATGLPSSLRLGDSSRLIYNDACREVYGAARFREALGRPAAAVWPEAGGQVDELIAAVRATGQADFFTDRPLYLDRSVAGEECYFTVSLTPVPASAGRTPAVLSVCQETTRRVLAERRLGTLARLGRALSSSVTEPDLATSALPVLARNAADHPAGALFRLRGGDGPATPLADFGALDADRVHALVEDCRAAAARHDGTLHAYGILAPEPGLSRHVLALRHNDARGWDAELEAYFELVAATIGSALHDRGELWAERQVARAAALDAARSASFAGFDREHAARERRLAAAQVGADFSSADDLDTLLGVAEHGFGLLFDGGSTVQLDLSGSRLLISGGVQVRAENLPEHVRAGLAGAPSADATSSRQGILLVPRSSATQCRAWIQFPRPRRIGPDEMIVADLLAQAFALAVDRVAAAEAAADRQVNLEQAVASQRLVGQAVGILIERHKLQPNQAFGLLRSASQNRNLKLREVSRRVIESGLEPDQA